MEEEHKSPKHKKKRLGFKITIGVILLLILGAGVYGFSVYNSVARTLKQTHQPLHRSESEKHVVDLTKKDPISILLLGVDQREGDRGRPDSLMVLTINPADQSVKMVSVPRDTQTEIIGKGTMDKINHSYTYGGIDMTVKTVESFLDIPIDFFVEVNMDGFKDLVDAVGGITVNNTLAFTYGGFDFPLGPVKLNGEKALRYSQMRHLDPRGDFGRQERQRKIIQLIIKEGASAKTLAHYGNILDAIGNNVKTNLTFDEIKVIQANYKEARHHFEQIQINGSGKEVEGVYYFFVPEDERTKLSKTLKEHLTIK
jgi:LCP family protein required for cell wall assembly